MGIEIVGADPGDPGAKGLVARFVKATAERDVDAALELLTEASRQGLSLNETPLGQVERAVVGTERLEDDLLVVPVEVEGEEMPFVVVEEGGDLRIDMDLTFEKAMGISPEEVMEGVGEALAERMGGMMEGVAESIAAGLDALGEPARRQWVLPKSAFHPSGIVEVACSLGSAFEPPFLPPPDELDTEEYGTEECRVVQIRYGTPEAGFCLQESEVNSSGFSSRTATVTAYGLPAPCELSVVWVRSDTAGADTTVCIQVTAVAPEQVLSRLESDLAENYGLEGAS